ncbi:hypothetical protein DU000_08370 [Parvibium lacunae]|uniref:Cytochrome c domain-containing protein n=1 Tax=Parvibium lacunae TaxID=1888893 RepID=A0A368L1Z2_9BURK|nr:hypothetical protein [Parvibium lacunae]RCS57461.1 hypothetical protein DU000_08370 [Parvibium lacunae]
MSILRRCWPQSQRGLACLLAIASLVILSSVGAYRYVNAQPNKLPHENMVRGYFAIAPAAKPAAAIADNPSVSARSLKGIAIPGVTVFLTNTQTGKRSEPTRTDLSGRFTLFAPEPGTYTLCWKSEVYESGCDAKSFVAGRQPQFLSTVTVTLPARTGFTSYSGKVTQADGRSVRAFDPLLNLNAFAQLTLENDQGKRLATVYVNNQGEYLLPYVPTQGDLRLIAFQENAKAIQTITRGTATASGQINRVNLVFDNHRPEVLAIHGRDRASGLPTHNVSVGALIELSVEAKDKDGDPLEIFWQVGEGEGKLAQATGPSNRWQLPKTAGRFVVTALAMDKKGGYDKATFTVLATGQGTPFTGQVVDLSGNPIQDAEVEVISDDQPNPIVKTNAQGRIVTNVKLGTRYVVNIRKPGYALNAQIYDRPITGGRWLLRQAQLVTVDPTRPIKLTHRRSQKECSGPDSRTARLGPAGESALVPEWQDGQGNPIDAPTALQDKVRLPASLKASLNQDTLTLASDLGAREAARLLTATKTAELARTRLADRPGTLRATVSADRPKDSGPALIARRQRLPDCGPGVSVRIPANSIVDANGQPVTTPIQLAISTIDPLSPQQMPGDESVIASSGNGGYIETFGAGILDLPNGMQLKPGRTATVIIPVDRSRRIGSVPLPATVPALSYNERRGLWVEEGVLNLQTVNGVLSYVGEVKHFSAFNADNVKTNASCVRVFSPSLPGQYDLEVAAPLGGPGGPIKILKKTIDQSSTTTHVIYNLPNNTNITLAPMTTGANPQLLGYYVVNSGPPQAPNNSPLVPPQPYDSCKAIVILKINTAPDVPIGGEFLHGLGYIDAANLGFDDLTYALPTGNALRDALVNASRNYYSTLDSANPGTPLTSLEKFRDFHGFSQNPAAPNPNETVATYANSGDLGFGRDMHCLKKINGDVVCYVSNYGFGYDDVANSFVATPDTDDAEAAATRITVGASAEIATVAMEYSDIPGSPGNKTVKFYVFKKGLTDAAAVTPTNPTGAYARSISANLDGHGERPVPQLCLICHGGAIPQQSGGVPAFSTGPQVTFNARFLPFDHSFFTFSASGTKAAQELAFKTLNEQIVNAAPPVGVADPIREVVAGLNNNGAAATQIHNFTVPGWQVGQSANVSAQDVFYRNVVATSCRTCHIAQPFPQLQFNTSRKFLHLDAFNSISGNNNFMMLGTAQSRVCGDYSMPHALRTHELFWDKYPWNVTDWGAPPTPYYQQFQSLGNGFGAPASQWRNDLCTTFLSGSVATPSRFYTQAIQSIWNGKCTACHVSGGQASFAPLTSGVSLGTLNGGLITPGNDSVAANTLLQRITEAAPNNRMPPNCFRGPELPNTQVSGQPVNATPCLSQIDIDKIKVWLRSGAH